MQQETQETQKTVELSVEASNHEIKTVREDGKHIIFILEIS